MNNERLKMLQNSGLGGLLERLGAMDGVVGVGVIGGGPDDEMFGFPGMGQATRKLSKLDEFARVRSAESIATYLETQKVEMAERILAEYALSHDNLLKIAQKYRKQRNKAREKLAGAIAQIDAQEQQLSEQRSCNARLREAAGSQNQQLSEAKSANDLVKTQLKKLAEKSGKITADDINAIIELQADKSPEPEAEEKAESAE